MVKKTSNTSKAKSTKASKAQTKTVEVAAQQTKAQKVSVKKAKAAPAVEAAPVEQVNTDQQSTTSTQQHGGVATLLTQLTELATQATTNQKQLSSTLKSFGKSYKREMKELERQQARSRRGNKKDPNRPKRAPSGFAVPSKISGEMCTFLGLQSGAELSRTDVTKKVTAYIKEKQLQVPTNRRSFVPDQALGSILGPLQEVDKERGYTYFNLQRYITPHIISNSASAQ